jgi:hypothetical protein
MEKAYKYLLDRGFEDNLEHLGVEDSITPEQIQKLIDTYCDLENLEREDPRYTFDTGYDLGVAMTLACGKEKA